MNFQEFIFRLFDFKFNKLLLFKSVSQVYLIFVVLSVVFAVMCFSFMGLGKTFFSLLFFLVAIFFWLFIWKILFEALYVIVHIFRYARETARRGRTQQNSSEDDHNLEDNSSQVEEDL